MMKQEIYRILCRKILWLAVLVATAFSLYYGLTSLWQDMAIHDGEIYRGWECNNYNRRITKEFAGPLTEETIREIWEKYGEPVNNYGYSNRYEDLVQSAGQEGNDNYCNTFVARKFAEKIEKEDGTVSFILPEDLSGSRYLDGSYTFGYAGGYWSYWDCYLIAFVMVSIVVIIGVSPTFSEDYAFRTADIILPTAKGRFRAWWTRTGASFLFASAYYWLMSGITFVQCYLLYGPDGLSVSCGLTYFPYFMGQDSDPIWKALLILHLGGWFSILALVLQVQAISSGCKSSFGSLLWSLAAFLGPIAVIRVVLDNLPYSGLVRWLKYFGYSMPFSFAGMYLQAPPSGKQIVVTLALATVALTGVLGAKGWCRHQVKN